MIILAGLGGVDHGVRVPGALGARLPLLQQHGFQRVALSVLHAGAGGVGVVVLAVGGAVDIGAVVARLRRLLELAGGGQKAALDALMAAALAQHQRLGQRDLQRPGHAGAVLVQMVHLAALGTVDRGTRRLAAGGAGFLACQQGIAQ